MVFSDTIPQGTSTYTIPLSAFTPSGSLGFDSSHVRLIYPYLSVPTVGATFSIDRIALVPEPATSMLLLGGVLFLARRRHRVMYR